MEFAVAIIYLVKSKNSHETIIANKKTLKDDTYMKKFITLTLCMLTLFVLFACATLIYPGLPNISEDPMKGIEIYCWQAMENGNAAARQARTDKSLMMKYAPCRSLQFLK